MRAGDLATPFPDTLAVEAARLLDARNLPGLIVVDNRGVIDEAAADVFVEELGARTVAEVADGAELLAAITLDVLLDRLVVV